MNKKRSSIVLIINSLCNALLQFFIVIMIARTQGAEATGMYAIAQSYILPAMFLGMFGLRQQALMDHKAAYDGNDYLSVRTLYGGVVFVLAIACAALFEPITLLWIMAALALVKFIDGYSEIIVGMLQREQQYQHIAILSVTRLISGVAAFALSYYHMGELALALFHLAAALALHYLLCELRICEGVTPFAHPILTLRQQSRHARHALVRFGFPIAVGLLISTMQVSAVRIILDHYSGKDSVGYFSVVLQLIAVGQIIIQAIGNAFTPALHHAYEQREGATYIKQLLLLVFLVIGCVLAGSGMSLLIGEWLIVLLFGKSFVGLQSLLLVGCLAALPYYLNTILFQSLVICKMPSAVLWINSAGLIVLIATALLFIPAYGPYGAYYCMALSIAVQGIISYLVLRYWSHLYQL